MTRPDYLSEEEYEVFVRVVERMAREDPFVRGCIDYLPDGSIDAIQEFLATHLVKECILRPRGHDAIALEILAEELKANDVDALMKLNWLAYDIFNGLAWLVDPHAVAAALPPPLDQMWADYAVHPFYEVKVPGAIDPDEYLLSW